jgi:hypothetical protein
MNKQRWLRLDCENGWQAVVPDVDMKAHASLVIVSPDGEKEGELARWDCPCRPEVDWRNQIVIHNSFEEIALHQDPSPNTNPIDN